MKEKKGSERKPPSFLRAPPHPFPYTAYAHIWFPPGQHANLCVSFVKNVTCDMSSHVSHHRWHFFLALCSDRSKDAEARNLPQVVSNQANAKRRGVLRLRHRTKAVEKLRERVSPPVGVFVRSSPLPTTHLRAEMLTPRGKENESPVLILIFWCAMAALTSWCATLE